MSEKPQKKSRLLWNLFRWAMTLAAIGYVLSQITWKDRLLITDPERQQIAISGWLAFENGNEVFDADDGRVFPIAAEERSEKFVPGFWTLLKGINRSLLVIALAVYPISVLLLAWRWQLLLRTHDLDPGYMEALRLNWIGLFTNFVLPGSTGGDLIKGVCIYRRSPGKRVAAVMTVLVDRVVGLISLMIIGTVAALIQADDGDLKGISQTTSWILVAIMGGGAIFFSARLRRLLKIAEIVERLPFKKRIQEVDQSVFHYRHHLWLLGGNVAISFLIHATTIFCIYLIGRSLRLTVPLMFYFEALPVIFTAGAFFPSIGGLGILESLFAHFFMSQGTTASSAVALCILYRLMILVGSLPGAIFTYREFSAHGIPKLTGDDELGESDSTPAASMSLTY